MHLSVHQWLRSAIPDSQPPTSPIGFLFLKLPPPPCAVLLVYVCYNIYIYISYLDCVLLPHSSGKNSTAMIKDTSMDISHAAQFHKPQTNQLHPKPSNYVTKFEPILLILEYTESPTTKLFKPDPNFIRL